MAQYPKGKLNDTDEGELVCACYIKDGRLIIDFGKSLTWVALDKEGLRRFIETLEDQYNKLNA
ncbi:hypothetical protein IH981_03765 [Patescibacteria group bacterium]|nr:hypothetical protein [Patescibacteria group bacterium]